MSEYGHDEAMRDLDWLKKFAICSAFDTPSEAITEAHGDIVALAAYIERIEARQREADEHIERVESENERLQREVTRSKKDVASLSAQRDRGRNKHHKERNRFLRLQAEAKRIEAERDAANEAAANYMECMVAEHNGYEGALRECEAERDKAHRMAGKAMEDVRLERGVYVKLTKILKEKVRTLEAERDEWKLVAEWLSMLWQNNGLDCSPCPALPCATPGVPIPAGSSCHAAILSAAIEAVRSSHE